MLHPSAPVIPALRTDRPPPGSPLGKAIARAARGDAGRVEFLTALAAHESGFDLNARASRSSAAGAYQFTRGTWLALVRAYGSQSGLLHETSHGRESGPGRDTVAEARHTEAILALRSDPGISSTMAAHLLRENVAYLSKRLGRPASAGEAYVAHFLGPARAVQLITLAATTPHAPAAARFPEAASANPDLFYESSGARRSVAALLGRLTKDFHHIPAPNGLASGPRAEPPASAAASRASAHFLWLHGRTAPPRPEPTNASASAANRSTAWITHLFTQSVVYQRALSVYRGSVDENRWDHPAGGPVPRPELSRT